MNRQLQQEVTKLAQSNNRLAQRVEQLEKKIERLERLDELNRTDTSLVIRPDDIIEAFEQIKRRHKR